MATFTVTEVIDGDTFDVLNGWRLKGQEGQRVRPTGYNTPEIQQPGYAEATQKLTRLIKGKTVELGSAFKIDRGRLVCDVFLGGRNLSD